MVVEVLGKWSHHGSCAGLAHATGDQLYLSSHTALCALSSSPCSQGGDTCKLTQNSLCLLSLLSYLLAVNGVFRL